jgi:rod shape-determining protein MreC
MQAIARPFWNIKNNLSDDFNYFFAFIGSRKNLVDENQKLSDGKAQDDLKLLRFNILEKENADLKAMLGRKDSSENQILAYVLMKPPQSYYDILIVDIGSNLGIKVGDKVEVAGGAVVGEVSEVYANTSKVKIYSSSGGKMDAMVERSNVPVVLVGNGNGQFEAQMPKESDIKNGDLVSAAGLSGVIFGTVRNVESNASDAFQKVLVKAPFNVSELRTVLIDKSN